jgi:hypothetical protein
VIVPAAALPPTTPLTSQITPVFEAFDTVALNGCAPPGATTTEAGEMLTATWGNVMVTAADADALASTAETAVTLTVAGLGTEAGAL